MMINDFSSLLQLAATLNIALVAVEYARIFTNTVIENIFKFRTYVEISFKQCYKFLIDKEIIQNITPVVIEGKSTWKRIEGLKRENELLRKNIEDTQKEYEKKVISTCKSKSLSSLSLWFFFYCVIFLFLGGVENVASINIHYLGFYLSLMSLLFLILAWTIGESKRPFKWFDTLRLKHCIVYFITAIIISLIISYFYKPIFIESYWNIILPISTIIPFVNFFGFLMITYKKFKKVKNEISEKTGEIYKKCKQHTSEVNSLVSTRQLADDLLKNGE